MRQKILAGERLTPEEGLYLLTRTELTALGFLANKVRFRFNPKPEVTYVMDTNPNYTNICRIRCRFCAFYRSAQDPDAYTLTVEEVVQKAMHAAEAGTTTMLLQGGVNPDLPLEYYVELVRRLRNEAPQVLPHFFSPPEITGIAERTGLSIREVLQRLKEAGQVTLPGGGAEVLSDRVRAQLSPDKGPASKWLEVMRQAHCLGFKTTATMMYGHLEKDEDIIEHLERIRSLQDETNGFTAFIPWSFKPANTYLEKQGFTSRSGPVRYLRLIALSRIYLDNFPHIQASWFSEGKHTGQVALHFGADDFGGTLLEENVHKSAGFINISHQAEVEELIHESGFTPVQRTTLYERINA
ncbi:MAG: cyclic dehypoxanthinyl futalosine synthase [bacterium]|nr:cyclic dehypoxanthinyl futalosine synthase [bacterium]